MSRTNRPWRTVASTHTYLEDRMGRRSWGRVPVHVLTLVACGHRQIRRGSVEIPKRVVCKVCENGESNPKIPDLPLEGEQSDDLARALLGKLIP